MGTYTGFRCKIQLKDEFVPVMQKKCDGAGWDELGYDFLDEFAYRRSDSIPNGGLMCVPDEWETEDQEVEWECRIDKDNVFIFQTSLKNYGHEIETFIEDVVPKIAESSIHLEMICEIDYQSTLYKLCDDGQVHEIEGIEYESMVDYNMQNLSGYLKLQRFYASRGWFNYADAADSELLRDFIKICELKTFKDLIKYQCIVFKVEYNKRLRHVNSLKRVDLAKNGDVTVVKLVEDGVVLSVRGLEVRDGIDDSVFLHNDGIVETVDAVDFLLNMSKYLIDNQVRGADDFKRAEKLEDIDFK
jgi:hypothetical protein